MFKVIYSILMYFQSLETFIIIFSIIFLFKNKKRKTFIIGVILLFAISFVLNHETVFLFPWKEFNALYTSPYFKIDGIINFGPIIVFILITLSFTIVYDLRFIDILFATTTSYIIQHFYYNLTKIIVLITHAERFTWPELLIYTGTFILCIIVYCFVLMKIIHKDMMILKSNFKTMISIIGIITINIISSWTKSTGMKNLAAYVYALVLTILLIIMQFFSYSLSRTEYEKELTERALDASRREFAFAKNNYETISRKAHDLKYILKKQNLTEQSLFDLQESLKEFETITNTGNDIINIVLSEKRLICLQNSIDFSFVVDYELLSFIDETDLFLLLNNALDNAIEAEKKESKNERYIYLKIAKANRNVIINIENYCSKKVIFDKNIPVTSKKDKTYHGIGSLSMKYTVEKYKGDITFSLNDNVFSCFMIFLLPNDIIHKQDKV